MNIITSGLQTQTIGVKYPHLRNSDSSLSNWQPSVSIEAVRSVESNKNRIPRIQYIKVMTKGSSRQHVERCRPHGAYLLKVTLHWDNPSDTELSPLRGS